MPSAAPFSTELLHIPVAADGAPLGAQQKKFNTLIQRIAAQRELLAQWQQAEQDFRRRYAQELKPAALELQALMTQHLHWLDAAYARKGLTKAERATLADVIARMAADLAQTAPDQAVAEAGANDVVLIAGKGHEDYQETAGQRQPFSDMAQARDALARRGAVA